MAKINGTYVDVSGKTLKEYLDTTNYNPKQIAVECNGQIVPKIEYDTIVIKEDDQIEVVSFVGGG